MVAAVAAALTGGVPESDSEVADLPQGLEPIHDMAVPMSWGSFLVGALKVRVLLFGA